MLSEKAMKNKKACRFCWMCRHLCPVGLQTGRESNTPRAKGMLLDMVEKGARYSPSMALDMYECFLCGACAGGCETGFDARVFIREARSRAIAEGVMPAAVDALLESLAAHGNIFGAPAGGNPATAFASAKADTLLYVGATAIMKTPEMATAAAKLLAKAGVQFVAWNDEPGSGAELADLIGHVGETVESIRPLAARVRDAGVKTIVALDPYQAKAMRDYPSWGVDLGAEVTTATAYFADLVGKGALQPKAVAIEDATYHDTSRLARDLDETQPARDLLASMSIGIREMFLNRGQTRCCGDEVTLAHSPAIVALTAAARWNDAKRCGAAVMIAPCPASFHILDSHKPEWGGTVSLMELLAGACGVL